VAKGPYFNRTLFAFLRELADNNDRAWFQDNKARYVAELRDPALAFIEGFAPSLYKISDRFLADPRTVGGSLFRIYRDTRFSKDKRPYKTHVGIQFRHEVGRDAHAPGFYLHLEPGSVWAAAGVWHPERDALAMIREAIIKDPGGWKRAVGGKAFRARARLGGESLKRAPRGYDPEHPMIEELKRKDFVAVSELSERAACKPDFATEVAASFRAFGPLMRYLCKALGVSY